MRTWTVVIVSTLASLAIGGDVGPAHERSVTLVLDGAPGPAALHGLDALEAALRARGWQVTVAASLNDTPSKVPAIVAGTSASGGPAARLVRANDLPAPTAPESLVVTHAVRRPGVSAAVLCGADDRGLMYAALDAADWIRGTPAERDPVSAIRDVEEAPFVLHRSLSIYTMNRAHWESRFHDERYWARYLDMLAADRFNHLLVIFGYENGGFLAPPYPYFFDTPGFHGVRMLDLAAEQQRRNLAALNRLIDLAHERGIAVGVGIWDHIYRGGVQTGGADWTADYKDRPPPNTVVGVTAENLNEYTLASLRQLLVSVPRLDSIQFRIHEESGLKREEMDAFWRAVFAQVHEQRPTMLIEARAKGMPDSVIDAALSLGLNLRIGTKYWMEQMGLPFHPTHVNPPDQQNRRHGYADLLRHPQRYQMNWRLWNGGTSRVLLWGDPDYVRRYSESTRLYDSRNWDVNEPLATKMEAQRPDAAPFELMPTKYRYYDYEFERYWHFFQVWGRVGYNPAAMPEIWDREFVRRFGSAGPHVETALHRASQVLPMIVAAVYPYRLFPTTRGWAERQTLGNTLAQYARNEGTDVQQFESFADAARRIASGGTTARRTPEATSRWFEQTADTILKAIEKADAAIGAKRGNEYDSTIVDLRILANLARFHGRRSRAAVSFNLFTLTRDVRALDEAIAGERAAIDAWKALVDAAGDHYTFNMAMGACRFDLCGHWRDELPALEQDLAQLERQRRETATPPVGVSVSARYPPPSGDRSPPVVQHERVQSARPGEPLRIVARVTDPSGIEAVRLRYRHVTQFEDYEVLPMEPTATAGTYAATVPGSALSPAWDFMYFIEAVDKAGNGTMWPDMSKEMPYVVVKVR